jgi:hypothetical protein
MSPFQPLRLRFTSGVVLYHLMRADLLERARRYSFLITLGFVVFAAYLYLPPKEADYLTLGLDHYRGVYNSAWIGAAAAVLSSALLSLPAFYLVKNAVERDERTRVGQIIATTPLSKPLYTLGKAFSNFVFLAVMVGVIALAAAGMQLIRGESSRLDPWGLLSPFVFCVLPAMAMIAAFAVLFETISWMRGTLGNVVYFFLWMGVLIATAASLPIDPHRIATPANDVWGISVILSSMMRDTAATFPNYSGSIAIGAITLPAPLQTFTWEGIRWTTEIILGRLLWFGAAIGVSLIAAIFFHRFDPALEKPARARAAVMSQPAEPEREETVASLTPIQLSPLIAHFRSRPISLLLAELRLMLKGAHWWWFIVALGLIVAGLLVPTDSARQLLLVAWLWPLALWSSMGCREIQYDARQLVFSAPHLLRRQLPMLWLAGILVAALTGSGVAVSFALAGEWTHLLAWGTAALFIPTLALTLGIWSGGNKLFEVVYIIWWYAGPVNQAPYLDFMGTGEQVSIEVLLVYWVGTVILLGLAVLGRRRQAQM